jgi:hypothetical protein
MVCNRCILVVKQELQKMDIEACNVSLGEVETTTELTQELRTELASRLDALGFEVLDDSKQQLIKKNKNIIISYIHHSDDEIHQNFSDILSGSLHKDYSYLSKFFSEVEGMTIEKFIINHKIERIKSSSSMMSKALARLRIN